MTLTTAITIAREVTALYSNVTRYVVTVLRISIQLPAEVLKSNQAKQTLHTCLAGHELGETSFFFTRKPKQTKVEVPTFQGFKYTYK